MATEIKIYMSFILRRPNSFKTSISPDASMLRRLVRDRNCHQVLRGILESLLHYLTQDLPKRSNRNRSAEKPDSGTVAVQNHSDCSEYRTGTSMKQTKPQTCCTLLQIPEEQSRTDETSSKMSIKIQICLSDPQKHRLQNKCGRDKIVGDLIPRRLSTFQLLQSKFTRSTSKPSISHQREVGALSHNRAADYMNCGQDSERNMTKRDRAKRERLQKVSSVKEIVAKFVTAEQKERGMNLLDKQPVKPRLIGRGLLLSFLMERFENMATLCKGSDVKRSHERPSEEVKATCNIKDKVGYQVRQQAAEQTQHKLMKRESTGQRLKPNPFGRKSRPETVVDLSNSKPKEKNKLKAQQSRVEQLGEPFEPADSYCLLKHAANANKREDSETGTLAGERWLKYGRLEQLCSSFVTEWSFPQPFRLSLQVQAPLICHVATIMPCCLVWSMSADYSPKQYLRGNSTGTSEKTPNEKKDTHKTAQYSHSRSAAGSQNDRKYTTEGVFKERAHDRSDVFSGRVEIPDPPRPVAVQRRMPSYVIPQVYRFDYQHNADHPNSSSQCPQPSTPSATISPSQSDTAVSDLKHLLVTKEKFQDFTPCPCDDISIHTIIKGKPAETTAQEKNSVKEEVAQVDTKDLCTLQSLEDIAVTLPKIQSGREKRLKPKYTTINYGDPSVKQTYKPKVIRFTDTFTF